MQKNGSPSELKKLHKYEDLKKEVALFDENVIHFASCKLDPREDPYLVAQMAFNDGKWSEQFFKILERANRDIRDKEEPDYWRLLFDQFLNTKT